ncbi:hypothetical protein SAMN06297129_0084 [Pseudooceanicola antarcticus]|uniref:Uncharacterized protein n=1 Tax=Pseudooceanicola antarcticus TaxID=1247613 RepID=A0A285HJ87_9RHOB|nr:hypothetical protein [Pseudooceanicola antarcticus]PJE27937.1 hypothetical protein CVM39_15355 [Pseudooceanicola antarcticus]SNY35792.1 hypothetical protein SAMN06297129_0084 [Pseudooceanicola antarcticus]
MTSQTTLTKTRLLDGKWEGVLTVPETAPAPQIEVLVDDHRIENVEVHAAEGTGRWTLRVPIPPEAISDGMQVFVIRDRADENRVLNSFCILAGEMLSDTLQAEVTLLRAELDMLKRAFRRHCVESGDA